MLSETQRASNCNLDFVFFVEVRNPANQPINQSINQINEICFFTLKKKERILFAPPPNQK